MCQNTQLLGVIQNKQKYNYILDQKYVYYRRDNDKLKNAPTEMLVKKIVLPHNY